MWERYAKKKTKNKNNSGAYRSCTTGKLASGRCFRAQVKTFETIHQAVKFEDIRLYLHELSCCTYE